jgi:RNA polymerase sigma factor, sigma-70 family
VYFKQNDYFTGGKFVLVFYLAAIDSDESKNKFEYIYRKYYRFMLRTASSIIRDSSLAEDAVHETFVQLLKEIDSLRIDNEKSLQSYLYILTRERTIDFLRKWERRRGVLTDYENRSTSFDNFKEPEEIVLTNLQLNKAVSILSDMPSIYRRTLVLRVKGYSIREIAQITNSSESNVKTRIHRARAILLKSFDT